MTRMFYRIADKTLFDIKAFTLMAENQDIDMEQIYDIFGLDQSFDVNNFIEV